MSVARINRISETNFALASVWRKLGPDDFEAVRCLILYSRVREMGLLGGLMRFVITFF